MYKCKCGFLKSTEKQTCGCNVKQFNKEKEIKKKNPKPIKQISDKKKARLKDKGTEGELFKVVWKLRSTNGSYKCEECQTILYEKNIKPDNFHHIKAKGKYPELRYEQSNITIICSDCHYKKHN